MASKLMNRPVGGMWFITITIVLYAQYSECRIVALSLICAESLFSQS